MIDLTETQRSTITHALDTAGRKYLDCAREFRALKDVEMNAVVRERLAQQFEQQARDCDALAATIEEAETIWVES